MDLDGNDIGGGGGGRQEGGIYLVARQFFSFNLTGQGISLQANKSSRSIPHIFGGRKVFVLTLLPNGLVVVSLFWATKVGAVAVDTDDDDLLTREVGARGVLNLNEDEATLFCRVDGEEASDGCFLLEEV